jgi:hypothetical protein
MKNTIKVIAVCVGAPLVALGVGVPTAWADPGGCSGVCSVGGAGSFGDVPAGNGGIKSGGKANGGHLVGPNGGSNSGGLATSTGPGTGHIVLEQGSASGNFNSDPGKGHCTGSLSHLCE